MKRLLAACGAVALLLASVVVTIPASADTPDAKLLLLMDSSGSMREPANDGRAKIDAAKAALNTVVGELTGTAQVGMRVYGAGPYSAGDPGACTDSQLVVPIKANAQGPLRAAIARYQ